MRLRFLRGALRMLAVAVIAVALPVWGATKQWTNNGGSGDGLWATASNWSPVGVPTSSDDVQIGVDQTAGNCTLTASTSINSLTITNPYLTNSILEIKFGGTLTLANASSIASGTTIYLNNGNIAGAGALTINGTINWASGQITGTGALTTSSGSNVNLTGTVGSMYLGRTTSNAGTWSLGSTTNFFYFYNSSSLTFTNTGSFNFQADEDIWSSLAGPFSFVNNSGGVLKKTGGTGTSYVRVPFTNNSGGEVKAESGTLALNGGGSSTGAFTTIGGASPTKVAFTGAYTLNNGTTFTGAGDVSVESTVTLASGSTISIPNLDLTGSSSVITGAGSLTITSDFDWNGGNLSGGSTTTIDTGVTATLGDTYYKYLDAATLHIKGTAEYTSSIYGFYIANGATMNINAGGTFAISSNAHVNSSGTTSSIINNGTLQKTGGTGTSTIYIPLTTSGTFSATSGNLAINNGATVNGGTFNAGTTSILEITGGTATFSSAASFTGTGSFRLNGGNVRVPTGVSVTIPTLILNHSSSILGGAGTVTIGNLTWNAGQIGLSSDTGGSVNVTTTAALTNTNYKYLHYSTTFDNNGTLTYTGTTYPLYLYNGSTLINDGIFDTQGDTGIYTGGTAPYTVTNNGTFKKSSGTGSLTINTIFNNSATGTLEAQTGRIDLSGGGTNSGAIASAAAGTIRISSTYTLNSTSNFSSAGGAFEIVSSGLAIVPSGSLSIPNFTLAVNGYLAGAGTVTLTGNATWSGGQMGHPSYTGGTTIVDAGATLTLSGSTGAMYLNYARTLTNNGTINYTSASNLLYLYNSSILNNVGIFDAQTDADIGNSGTNDIDNSGTFKKTAGSGTLNVNVDFDTGGGTVQATSGTLSLDAGGTHTAAVFNTGTDAIISRGVSTNAVEPFAGSGTIAFGGGTHTIDATSTLGGDGAFAFNSGTVTVAGSYAAATTTITNGTFTLNANGSTNVLTQSGGTLNGTGTFDVFENSTWSGGTQSGSGQTIFAAGKTLSMPDSTGYKYLDTRTFTNNGMFVYGGTGTGYYLQIYNNGTLVNAATGTIDLQTNTQIYGTSNGSITNNGTITKSAGTGQTNLSLPVNNSGTVSATSGTLAMNGGGTHTNGTFTATSPATIAFTSGTHTVSGTGTVGGTGTIAFNGGTTTIGVAFSPTATSFAGGTATINATANTDTFTMTSGTLGGSGQFNINQSGSWTSGTMSGSGSTVVAAGKTLAMNDGGYKYLDTRTLTNNGTITYAGSTGYYLQIFNNAVLSNPGAFQITGDNQIYGYGGGTINNSGSLTKTGGTGSNAIAPIVNNTGSVTASTGTLSFNGGGTHTNGTFTATSPGTIAFGGGTHTMSGTGSLTGTGTIGFTGATATVSNGYNPTSLNVSGGTVNFNSNGTTANFTQSNGTLSGSGTLTITNSATWSGGTQSGTGSTVIPSGKTLSIVDFTYKTLDTRTLLNQGTINYTAATHYLQLYNNGTLNNQNALNLSTDLQIYSSAGATLNNSGTITKSAGTGIQYLYPIVNNTGSITNSSGTLSLNGGGTHTNGSFTASGTGVIAFGSGTHAISGTGSLGGIGTFSFTGGTTTIGVAANVGSVVISGGIATFNANATAGTLNMTTSGGTLGGSGTFTVTGNATWAGGTMSGTGSTIISSGQTLDLTGSNYKSLDTRTITNNGTIHYPGTGGYYLTIYNNATVNNLGTFTIATDTIVYGYSGGTVNNSGSLTKTTGTGSLYFYPALNNSGTTTVQSGTLQLGGGGTHTGAFVADSGAILDFVAGTHGLSAAGSLSGAGRFRFGGGTTTINGSYSSGLEITSGTATINTNGTVPTFLQSGGTLNGTGTVTVANSATWSGGTMSGSGQTVFDSGSTISMPGTNYTTLQTRTLTNKGTLTYTSGSNIYLSVDSATIANLGTWDLQADNILYAYGTSPTFNNNGGTLKKTGGTGSQQFYANIQNSGNLLLSSGTLYASAGITQSAGSTLLSNGNLQTTTFNLAGGTLGGNGTLTGTVNNTGGIVAPGASAGSLTITGSYTQGASGDLNIELGGTTAGTQYDRLVVSGNVTLDGDLNVSTINAFTPATGNTFQILTFGSRTNDFANKNGLSLGSGTDLVPAYSSTDLQLTTNVVQADLALSASNVAGTIYNGQSFTYPLTITNGGGSNASGVTVSATLPSNVAFSSSSPAVCTNGIPVTCTIGNLANGASTNLSINVVATAPGTAQLNASVTASQYDPSNANNTASSSATISPTANLGVTITDTPDPVDAGTNVAYTIVVGNSGPDSATGVSLASTPDANLTFVSNSGGCTTAFPCSLGTLTSGQTVTITSTYTVAPSATANVSTTVTVSASSPVDLTSANDSATATTAVAQDADLSVSKTGPNTVSPDASSNVTYTIVVTNNGPSAANGVTLADPPAAGLTFVSASGACSSFPCNIGSLTVGQSATTTATYSISGGIGTTVTNTATVSATTPDGNNANNSSSASTTISNCTSTSITAPTSVYGSTSGNNASATFISGATYNWSITNGTITSGQGSSAIVFTAGASGSVTLNVTITAGACTTTPTATIPIVVLADVTVTKTGPASVTATNSSTVTYTIVAANNGPSPASSVVLSDPTPNGLSFVSATGVCSGGFPCSLGTLTAGQSVTTQVTFSVNAAVGTTFTNTASVSTITNESNAGNNSSSVATTVSSCPTPTITAPATVYGSTTGNSASVTFVNGATYAWSITNGTITNGQGTNNITFTAGLSGSVTLSVTVSAGACTATPTATIPIVVEADLAVAKSGPSSVSSDTQSTITYSIVVTNNGPSPAENIVLDDPTPNGLSFVSATGVCASFPCNIASLGEGQSITINATYNITGAAGTTVTNTASVSASTPDNSDFNDASSVSTSITACPAPAITAPASVIANSSGNTASVTPVSGASYTWNVTNGTLTGGQGTTNITFTAGATGSVGLSVTVTVGSCTSTPSVNVAIDDGADVSVTKTGPASTTSSNVTYTIVVTNNGPASAVGVSLADPAPANTTFVSASGACSGFPCTIGTLASGQSVATYVTFDVSAAAGTTVTNVATVTATSPDPNNANNYASAATGVSACPTPAITAPPSVYAQQANNTASVTSVAGATYNWSITNGTIDSGQGTSAITFTAGASGSVTLSVTVTSGACTSTPTATIPIQADADLVVVKTGPLSTVASTVTYTIVVTNYGPSAATGVTLTDPTPSGLAFLYATGACASFPCSLGTLNAGQSVSTDVTYDTAGAIGTTVTNVATVSSSTTDTNGANNSSAVSTAIGNCPAPVITAPQTICAYSQNNTATVAAQQNATYVWSITNGTITSGDGTNTITFTAGPSGTVSLGVTVSTNCTASATATAAIDAPSVTITGPTSTCPAAPVVLDAGSGFAGYAWSTGETTQSITVTPSQDTTYSVTVTTANGCTATDAHAVAVTANPVAAISTPPEVCAGSQGNIASVAAQQNATYVWTITNGTITSGDGTSAITFTAAASGTVTLGVTVASGSCTSTGTASIPIAALPSVAIAGPPSVCANAPFTLDAGANFASYLWSTGATTQTISVTQSDPSMTYSVTVTNAAGCAATDTHTVTLLPQPSATITAPASVPANSTDHTASVVPQAGAAYTWSITNGTITSDASASSITFTAGASGVLTLSVTVTLDGCSASATHPVTIGANTGCPTAAPQLVGPPNGATVPSPVTFQWNGVTDAIEYDLWIVSGGVTTLAGSTPGLSLTLPVPSGSVIWYVVARVADGCDALTSAQRTVTVAASDACAQNGRPQLTSPVGGIVGSPATFAWTAVPNAIGYRVWIEVNGTAPQDVGTTNGALTLTSGVPPGTVVAYVDAIFSGCPSTRSDPVTFTVPAPDPCSARASATPTQPANNSVVDSSSITFQWLAAAGADSYRLWASLDGAAPVVLGTSTTELSLTALISAQNVVWWLESLYEGCASTESARFRFTIPAAQNCGNARPDLLAPANNSTTTNGRVTFSWTSVPNAVAYELWLALGNGTPALIGTTSDTSFEAVVAPGLLEWFVRAIIDRCPTRDSQTRRFTFEPPAACAPVQRPVAIEPVDNAQTTADVTFSWSRPAGATRFELFVAKGNAAPQLLASTTETSARVSLANGAHRWFVRAYYGDECSPLDSAEQKVVIVPAPNACAPLPPPIISAPGQVSSGIELRVQWSPVAGATSYQLQLSATPDFDAAETITTTGTQHTLTRTNNGPEAVAVYARVRAVDTRCTPVPSVSPFGPSSAFFILPQNTSEGGAPLTAGGTATFAIPISASFAGQTFTATVAESWLTVSPASGVVPAGGMTLNAIVNLGALGAGANLAAIRLTFSTPTASNVQTHATTVSLPTISVSKVTPVLPAPKTTPPPDALIIPAVAHADGINSKFQSDVRVTNTSPQLLNYQVTFTPSGPNGIANSRQTTFAIEPGRTVALDDVLRTWFGTGGASVTGTLEVRPLTQTAPSTPGVAQFGLPNLLTFASSRTFNVTPRGTFGQYIPAIPFANFVGRALEGAKPHILSLQQIAQSDRYRTNLGLVEGSGEPVSLLVTVFGETGQKLTDFAVNLAGGEHAQLNGFLREKGVTTLSDGRVEIRVTSATGKVTAYASVLDNATSDPLLVTPVALTDDGASKWVVPGVADIHNGSANWQTDLRIFNAATEDATATFSFHSQSGGEPKTATVTIPAGQVRQFDKALASIFGVSNDGGAVHIATPNATRLVATARTYNQTSGGTYGQFISAVTPNESAALGTRPLQLLQVEESSRYRSNIGVAEVHGKPAKIEVTVVPPDAKFSTSIDFQLGPNEFRQLPSLLAAMGYSDTFNARVTVRVIEGEGRITAYASVIDQLTKDPTYVPAQ